MIWHSADLDSIKSELSYDEKEGLSSKQVVERIQVYGENRIKKQCGKTITDMVLKRFSGAMTVVLLVCAVALLITGILSNAGNWPFLICVLFVLLINGFAFAYIEKKTENKILKLTENATFFVKVLRNGEMVTVDTATLVPGDIVFLNEGDYIPADGRLLEATSLICDESAITHTHDPCEKDATYCPEDICSIEDRKNMVFAGCSVLYGRGVMVVTETGINTEQGHQISIDEQIVGNEISIKEKLTEISKFASVVVLVVSLLVFIFGIILNNDKNISFSNLVFTLLSTVAALSISALPESFIGSINYTLGFGLKNLFRKKVVVKNFKALEKLCSASVIISDKTGTLTKNIMTMLKVYDGNKILSLEEETPDENALTLIRTGALCCDGKVVLNQMGKKRSFGDPTEVSIADACLTYCNLTKEELDNMYPRMGAVPFSSERQLMTTINIINNRPFAVVKGSPDRVIECCTGGNLKGATEAALKMGGEGLRIIAVAIKPLDNIPSNPTCENMECDLSLLGLFGMADCITKETVDMIKSCKNAGITTVMITGDHITTATAIAEKIGLLQDGRVVVSGDVLSSLTDEELAERVENIAVYSRISSQDKIRVIKAWQQLNKTVVVTGDSAKDAIALKVADVGCAMGQKGTDVSKSAADLVLGEDSYISIGESIKTSRSIFKNIKRVTAFLLGSNLGELLVMLFGVLIFRLSPLTALALLFLNLITDFIPALALGAEKPNKNIMLMAPENKRESVLLGKVGISVLLHGFLIAVLSLVAYGIALPLGSASASAVSFVTISFAQLLVAFNLRSEDPLYKEGYHTNLYMLVATAFVLVATLLITLTSLGSLFGFAVIKFNYFLIAFALALVVLLVGEAYKTFVKK